MAISRVPIRSLALIVFFFLLQTLAAEDGAAAVVEASSVVTLDASNFSGTVAKHPIVVVEFYTPWCGHCMQLAPEYDKAASVLSTHEPPVVLAKVDANDELNKELASKYEVRGYPTLKILRNEGKNIQEYKGPRDAEGIIEYLKKQVGPASVEIKSSEDAVNLVSNQKILIVGIFTEFSGEEYDNFMIVAEELRSDYEFGHTLNAKLLQGELTGNIPIVRLFKPFDELFVDSQDFQVDALENFIESASTPIVTIFNEDPINRPFVIKFFKSPYPKVILFLSFSNENIDAFKFKYYEAASHYRGKNISFLISDLFDASQGAFQYFGLKEDQAPLIIIQENDGQKYLKPNLQPDEIATWLKEYTDGSLKPFRKSEPIPEANDGPVKIVVADTIHEMVTNSKKNVLLEFYAPWCGHCKKLAPILDEVAVTFENDADVTIAKMDATENDIPKDFEVKRYPTLYFSSARGKLVQYDGENTTKDIISFIQKSRDASVTSDSFEFDSLKDEL